MKILPRPKQTKSKFLPKVVLDVEGGIDKEALLKQMAEKDWEAVKKEVLTIVSRRYLEPSLKRVDVIRDVTLMKHTLAGTFITQVGFTS